MVEVRRGPMPRTPRRMVMKIHGAAEVLRIYIGDSDRSGGKLLYEAIVDEARRRGMAGDQHVAAGLARRRSGKPRQ